MTSIARMPDRLSGTRLRRRWPVGRSARHGIPTVCGEVGTELGPEPLNSVIIRSNSDDLKRLQLREKPLLTSDL